MMKKLLGVSLICLSVFASACTGGQCSWWDGEDCTGEPCSWSEGSFCSSDSDSLIYCGNDRTWFSEYCQFGCIVDGDSVGCMSQYGDYACGNITAKGMCRNNVAYVCSEDKLLIRDCEAKTCAARADGQVDCL